MILTLTNIFALIVVNRDILKLIAPRMRIKKEEQERKAKQRKPTLLGKLRKVLPLAHLQEMKKKIFALAKEETNVSGVSSSTSINFENYNQLLDAFKETHEEANRLVLSNNWLKGLNNWLENRVKALEKELDKSKNDFENMELIYKKSSCKCDSSVCENCESVEKKFTIL